MKALRKYLELYADPTAPGPFPFTPVEYGVLVPCYGEKVEVLDQLQNWRKFSESFLIVFIINEACDSESWAKESNRDLIAQLKKYKITNEGHDFYGNYEGVKIKVLDRTQERSLSQGVGEARKIGADYLLKLHSQGFIQSEFIFSTDADVTPPLNYFKSSQFFEPKLSALHFNFEHWVDADAHLPTMAEYEFSLRYYAWGLRAAGSAYCYPSIGSCLVIHLDAYVKSRGFPQKKAGEDFYLLNKLRKLGPLRYLPQLPLKIQARAQVRTPFGTSAALKKEERFLFYSPEVFLRLKDFLSRCEEALIAEQNFSSLQELWPDEAGMPDLRRHWPDLLKSSTDPLTKILHFHTWFDGFKTLRFIQALTRQVLPKQELPPSFKLQVCKSLESPHFLSSTLELSLLDYSRNRVDQLSHGRSIRQTRIYP